MTRHVVSSKSRASAPKENVLLSREDLVVGSAAVLISYVLYQITLLLCNFFRAAHLPYHVKAAGNSDKDHTVAICGACYTRYMSKQVTIYSADWCAYCHAAKDYLHKKGIEFTEKDVESDPAIAQEAVAKSNQMGIPVLDIDGTIIVGFDRPKIDAALGL